MKRSIRITARVVVVGGLVAAGLSLQAGAHPARMAPVSSVGPTTLLVLNDDGSTATPLLASGLHPGKTVAKRFRVRWPARPDFGLTITPRAVVDAENSCTHPEQVVDPTCSGSDGELSAQLLMSAAASTAAAGAACSFASLTFPTGQPLKTASGWTFAGPKDSDICVELRATLPMTSGNETQSDSATFDLRFDASAVESWNIKMGPQAMEGNLKVSPGDILIAGYDFTLPGTHPAADVTFRGGWVEFVPVCTSGAKPKTPKFIVSLPAFGYPEVPAGNPSWWPSGDQKSNSVYQGSLTLTTELLTAACGSSPVTLKNGGTFFALMDSDPGVKANIRWHYSAHGTSGSWSGTLGTLLPK